MGVESLINVLKRTLQTCLITKQRFVLFENNEDKIQKLIARAIKPGMISWLFN